MVHPPTNVRPPGLALAVLYAVATSGAWFGASPDDRIGGLLFLLLLLFGLLASTIVRFRPVPMAILLWVLAGAQTAVLIALLAAEVGDPGVVAFVNVVLIGGMVYVASLFRLARGHAGPADAGPRHESLAL